jgi:SGNH hydrolase-like domain, acetyltransferase AlgX
MTSPSGTKLWGLRLASVALSLAGSFVIGEIGLRVLVSDDGQASDRGIVEFCSTRHHRLTPNGRLRHRSYEFDYVWTNNSLGMRDRERPRAKPPGTFRVLFLGDSMVQGHGVPLEQTMAALLESRLNQPRGPNEVEVLNAGVFGYGPLLEYLYLEEILPSLQPDLVLLGFTLANDVGDDWFYQHQAHFDPSDGSVSFDDRQWPWSRIVEALDAQERARSGSDGTGSQGSRLWDGVKPLLRRSRVLRLVNRAAKEVREARDYKERREREFALVRDRAADIGYDLGLVNFDAVDASARREFWELSEGYVGRIAELCGAHGIHVVLVVIPPAERLMGLTHLDEPYEVLDDLGRDLGVPVIQLLPRFTRERARPLYYEYDRHWNAEGNRIAADVVGERLLSLGIVPTGAGGG